MYYRFSGIAGLALILAGCATPQHTNLLIFGTNTQVGLKVGADATQSPSIQVGYNRQELVLMPLLANTHRVNGGAADGTLYPCAVETAVDKGETLPTNCKFVGNDGPNKQDVPSVMASFGAKFDASKEGTDAKAGGAIAQYFATGLAARELARSGGAAAVATGEAAATASSSAPLADRVSYAGSVAKALSDAASVTDATLAGDLTKLDTASNSSGRFGIACAGLTKAACVTEIEAFKHPALVTMPARVWPVAAAYKFQ
ncbi:hypothetical protein [Sphingomonas sp.]|jgi:hypothetical protein|uniref:hypothetical protein n=1 Tax=Sphingomonas sp. TaxID=28214 RepID=UPI00356457F9